MELSGQETAHRESTRGMTFMANRRSSSERHESRWAVSLRRAGLANYKMSNLITKGSLIT
jgi:hypothetical protein